MEPDEAFGLVLRDLRKTRNISQEKLAFDSELDRTFISLLERGQRQPSLTTIIQVARALTITPEELMALVSKKLPENSGGKQ